MSDIDLAAEFHRILFDEPINKESLEIMLQNPIPVNSIVIPTGALDTVFWDPPSKAAFCTILELLPPIGRGCYHLFGVKLYRNNLIAVIMTFLTGRPWSRKKVSSRLGQAKGQPGDKNILSLLYTTDDGRTGDQLCPKDPLLLRMLGGEHAGNLYDSSGRTAKFEKALRACGQNTLLVKPAPPLPVARKIVPTRSTNLALVRRARTSSASTAASQQTRPQIKLILRVKPKSGSNKAEIQHQTKDPTPASVAVDVPGPSSTIGHSAASIGCSQDVFEAASILFGFHKNGLAAV